MFDPFIVALIVFTILLFLGMPVAVALGVNSLVYFFLSGEVNFLRIISERFFSGMDQFILLAIPLFMFMGEIMNKGNVTNELVDLANVLVGRFRGGLAYVNIFVSTLFAGMTGSALSDIAALGSMLIPAMEKQGYDTEFSTAVTVGSSLQGPIIPPSIPAVLVAGVAGISVGGVFLAGAFPGLLMGLACAVVTFIRARQRNYPRNVVKLNVSVLFNAIRISFLSLLIPIIVVGGIIFGFFTPTEAAAVAGAYALIIVFIIKKTPLKELIPIIFNVALSTGKVYFILGTANIFGWIISIEGIPQKIAAPLLSMTSNPQILLILISALLLFWGMFLPTTPAILIMSPIFFPIVRMAGVHPVHFGIIMVVCCMIGLATPPFGTGLFVALAIADTDMVGLVKELLPFFLAFILVVLLVIFIPELALFLPRLAGII